MYLNQRLKVVISGTETILTSFVLLKALHLTQLNSHSNKQEVFRTKAKFFTVYVPIDS